MNDAVENVTEAHVNLTDAKSYQDKRVGSTKKIWGCIALVLLILFLVWYFGFK